MWQPSEQPMIQLDFNFTFTRFSRFYNFQESASLTLSYTAMAGLIHGELGQALRAFFRVFLAFDTSFFTRYALSATHIKE